MIALNNHSLIVTEVTPMQNDCGKPYVRARGFHAHKDEDTGRISRDFYAGIKIYGDNESLAVLMSRVAAEKDRAKIIAEEATLSIPIIGKKLAPLLEVSQWDFKIGKLRPQKRGPKRLSEANDEE